MLKLTKIEGNYRFFPTKAQILQEYNFELVWSFQRGECRWAKYEENVLIWPIWLDYEVNPEIRSKWIILMNYSMFIYLIIFILPNWFVHIIIECMWNRFLADENRRLVGELIELIFVPSSPIWDPSSAADFRFFRILNGHILSHILDDTVKNDQILNTYDEQWKLWCNTMYMFV